jgi:hypothetical protein
MCLSFLKQKPGNRKKPIFKCPLEADVVGNNELLDLVRDEFGKLNDGGKLLLSVGCRDVLKLNVILLQFLINEQKLNGLYICVDIPQINVERLVKKYDISKEGLKYIDAITGLSSL